MKQFCCLVLKQLVIYIGRNPKCKGAQPSTSAPTQYSDAYIFDHDVGKLSNSYYYCSFRGVQNEWSMAWHKLQCQYDGCRQFKKSCYHSIQEELLSLLYPRFTNDSKKFCHSSGRACICGVCRASAVRYFSYRCIRETGARISLNV